MADTRTPVRGRITLRTSAQTSPASTVPVSLAKYAPAFRLRLAKHLAARAAQKRRAVAENHARLLADFAPQHFPDLQGDAVTGKDGEA